MKSGTTTLFDSLARHPAIAPCRLKEPGFFAFEEIWTQGFDWYESLFSFEPKTHRFALDGSTDYTKHPFCGGVAERLTESAPREFHLIYVMRDPIKRIESHARHTQYTKREVGRFPSPRADHGLDAGISPVNLAVSRYAYQLEPYRSFHDSGRLHLMTLEALQTDFETEIGRVLEFLELSPSPEITQAKHSNKAEERRHATWFSRKLRHSRYLKVLPPHIRQELARRFERKLDVAGRFHLTSEERAWLAELFRKDIESLRSDFGFRPPDSWSI